MTQRWKLTIEYDGTDFSGWQRQENAPSVQESLEKAIHGFCGETVTLHAAGRTDAGVHAVGQVAHVDIQKNSDEKTVRDAINFHARPHLVSVVKAEPVAADFEARFHAVKRTYCYRILMDRWPEPVLENKYAWHIGWDLDVGAMNKAAKHLLGTHDFSSFRAAECQAKSPLRSLDRLEFIENHRDLSSGKHIELWVEARSFLHHQVRNITGSLRMVGEGKWAPEKIKEVLDAKDRTKAGATAPASGLYLVRVDYPSTFEKAMDSLL